jgi:hypothetical protein
VALRHWALDKDNTKKNLTQADVYKANLVDTFFMDLIVNAPEGSEL